MVARIIASCCLLLALSGGTAHAYVDPTAGNALVQLLSGVFIVLCAAYVFLRNRIVRLFDALARRFRRRGP